MFFDIFNVANYEYAWCSKNDKTFIVSDKVEVENVRYKNRFGITIAADMYVPKDFDKSENTRQLS